MVSVRGTNSGNSKIFDSLTFSLVASKMMRNFHHHIRMCVYKPRRIINSGFLSYSFPYCPHESILDFSLFFFKTFGDWPYFHFWGRRISYNAICFLKKQKKQKKNVFWRESKFRSGPIPRDKVSNKKYFLVMGNFPIWLPVSFDIRRFSL